MEEFMWRLSKLLGSQWVLIDWINYKLS